jgi:UDP-glucose 4-epimerase
MSNGLKVAVTGPTGDIGRALLRGLEADDRVASVVGMARRPWDPASLGLTKTTYLQGSITDRDAVDRLVADADAVVHLAFIIMDAANAHEANVEGSRTVFEATVAAAVPRLVYASSVAAYGFHEDNPQPLVEDVPTRGTDSHPYSAQKAELEEILLETIAGTETQAWVFRPCIVAGEDAPMFVDAIPYVKWGPALRDKLPGVIRELFDQVPILKPVLPDPGVPFQLVHHDDVAAALRAGIAGKGTPGTYNLAGAGQCTVPQLADALGYYSVPIPELAVDATAEIVSRLPFMPAEARWIDTFRTPVLMDTTKAEQQLGWHPEHDARDTLRRTVEAVRADLEPRG